MYALIALTLRPFYIIGQWTHNLGFYNIDWVQQAAKLCVGVVQDWITLELAIRIRLARSHTDVSKTAVKKLRGVFAWLFFILTLALIAWTFAVLVTARKEVNHGSSFDEHYCLVSDILGYAFLCQVLVMLSLVAWLFIETLRAENREKSTRDSLVTQSL